LRPQRQGSSPIEATRQGTDTYTYVGQYDMVRYENREGSPLESNMLGDRYVRQYVRGKERSNIRTWGVHFWRQQALGQILSRIKRGKEGTLQEHGAKRTVIQYMTR
jgi:hypothetical protein